MPEKPDEETGTTIVLNGNAEFAVAFRAADHLCDRPICR